MMERNGQVYGRTDDDDDELTIDDGDQDEREDRRERCICGWPIAEADRLCTERDCFYRKNPLPRG